MFQWYEKMGLGTQIMSFRGMMSGVKPILPSWVYYSLPDGLWVYSFTSALLILWNNERDIGRFWLAIPFFCGVFIEILQGLNFLPGTFDYMDIAFSILGFLISKAILT